MLDKRRERERDRISLRTDLKDEAISNAVKSRKFQSFSEILNQPVKKQKGINIKKINNPFKPNVSFPVISKTIIEKEVDYNKFNASEIVITTESSNLSTSRCGAPQQTGVDQSITFKYLIQQEYTSYIKKLKKIYPMFKFNHYSDYSEQVRESYNLTNRMNNNNNYGSVSNKSNNKNNKKNDAPSLKVEMISSNIMNLLNLHSNYLVNPENFKIYNNFLEISDVNKLVEISRDFDLKGERIELELNKTLAKHSGIIYNYIERNAVCTKMIENATVSLSNKHLTNNKLSRKFILNSSITLLKSIKRQNCLKIIKAINDVSMLYKKFNAIEDNNNFDVKELSDGIDNIKELISKLRKYEVNTKLNILLISERNLMNFGNKNEAKLMENLASSIQQLFKMMIILDIDHNDLFSNDSNPDTKEINTKYNISLDIKNNDSKIPNNINNKYLEKDYSFSNKISFNLIFNHLDNKNVKKLLIKLLEILDLIIKDNVDIVCIIAKVEEAIKKLLTHIYELIKNKNENELNRLEIIDIISNCYINIISNYNYLLSLFKNNFGLIPKIFQELTNGIISEQQKYVKILLTSNIKEDILKCETNSFIGLMNEIQNKCNTFITFYNINWYEYTKEIYMDFINIYYEKNSQILIDELINETWQPSKEIDQKYQTYINNINKSYEEITKSNSDSNSNLNSNLISTDNDSSKSSSVINMSIESNDKLSKFLQINNENFSVPAITINIIEFLNDLLYLYKLLNNLTIQSDIVQKVYSFTSIMLSKTDDKINSGEMDYKTICMLCSHNMLFRYCLKYFTDQPEYKNEKIENHFNDIYLLCIDGMSNLLKTCSDEMINEFGKLDFGNYPVFEGKNKYNSYVKSFNLMMGIYENMNETFSSADTSKLLNNALRETFDNLEKIVHTKGRIDEDNQLKQFRDEFDYIKKVLRKLKLSNEKFRKQLTNIGKIVNPEKVEKKRKVKTARNNDKDEDDN